MSAIFCRRRRLARAATVALVLATAATAQAADYSVQACLGRAGQLNAAIASEFPAPDMRAPLSEPVPCSRRGTLVWALPVTSSDVGKPLEEVFRRPEFKLLEQSGVAGNLRVVKKAGRSGLLTAIERLVPKGVVPTVRVMFQPFGTGGVEAVCLRAMTFVPASFVWNEWGAKIPLGLWGGADDGGGGGVPLACQRGFSIRALGGGRAPDVDERVTLYSYHLNRRDVSERGVYKPSCPLPTYFGEATATSRSQFPRDVWVPIEIEAILNRPGYADGLLRLYVANQQVAEARRLVFRCGSEWKIRGLALHDMFGGTTTLPQYQSPRKQSLFYNGYKLYTVPAIRP